MTKKFETIVNLVRQYCDTNRDLEFRRVSTHYIVEYVYPSSSQIISSLAVEEFFHIFQIFHMWEFKKYYIVTRPYNNSDSLLITQLHIY